jgi:hypothetical protein
VNDAAWTNNGTLLMAVADGGVARLVTPKSRATNTNDEHEQVWDRPSASWPSALASQGEAIVHDNESDCVYVAHNARGSSNLCSVLSSCDGGDEWVLIGGWDGNTGNDNSLFDTEVHGITAVVNGLNLSGTMLHSLAIDWAAPAGLKQRDLFAASVLSNGTIFAYNAQSTKWAPTVPIPAATASVAANAVAALMTSRLLPGLLFAARTDAIFVRNTSAAASRWVRLAEGGSTYSHPSAMDLLLDSSTSADVVRVVFGASSNRYGSDPALYTAEFSLQDLFSQDADGPSAATSPRADFKVSVTQRYLVQSAVTNTSSAETRAALGRMHVSSVLVMRWVAHGYPYARPALIPLLCLFSSSSVVMAGLSAGDYFDLYLPPYLLKSNNGAVTFAPHKMEGLNSHVAALKSRLGDGCLCAATNGNGLQCTKSATTREVDS